MTTITVCVPVYNAAAFVSETLEHIAAQTFRDFKVLVSVDRSDDSSESVCRKLESDSRFEVVAQTERLGWVGNVNALIERVDTPYFCITPHDDLLQPTYLEATHAVLASEPATSCVYSDIQGFGSSHPVISQPEVRGDRMARVLDVLLNHYAAVTFRGLVRRRNADDRPYLPVGIPDDFAADSAWTIRLALRGDLRRVPALLYGKRYDAASVHAGWSRRTRGDLVRLHGAMVAECTRIALEEISDPAERDEVLVAGLLRASGQCRAAGWGVPETALEIATGVAVFARAIHDLGPLPDVNAVRARTGVSVLRDASPAHELVRADSPLLVARVIRKARDVIGF